MAISDPNVLCDPISVRIDYGIVFLDSRLRPEGNKWIGEGRTIRYGLNGNVTEDTGWQPTGVVLYWE